MSATDILDDQGAMRAAADNVVAGLLADGVAEKVEFCGSDGTEYWNLASPDAFSKKLIVITILGYPEEAGVWSYSLLREGRVDESSMRAYFEGFGRAGIGMIAINPNYPKPDIEGLLFHDQLERLANRIGSDQQLGFIGFSMGGKILLEFLQRHEELHARTTGVALIDPTLPHRASAQNLRLLLDNKTLLISSEDERMSPGKIAEALLEIDSLSFPGAHGEMPSMATGEVLRFFEGATE